MHLPSGLASILKPATPLFTVLAAHLLTAEEKLSRAQIVGTAAGMAGVAWLIGPDALWGQALMSWAEFAVLLAALSYAFSAIFARRMPALRPEANRRRGRTSDGGDRVSRSSRPHL